MTSATTQDPPSRRGRAERREPVSRLRRWTQVVLVVGSALALAAAFGPAWVVRVGVGVAVGTSVVACLLAWRETFGERRRHARDLVRTHREHGQTLRAERRRNAEVVDMLTERLRSTGMVVAGQRSTISRLTGEIGELCRERDRLVEQSVTGDALLGILRSDLRTAEAALLAVREAERSDPGLSDGARVRSLPRRAETTDQRPETAEPQDSVLDPAMAELAMVLPNYEASRRVG